VRRPCQVRVSCVESALYEPYGVWADDARGASEAAEEPPERSLKEDAHAGAYTKTSAL